MLQHIGNKAKSWLMDMLKECTRTKHIPSIWRNAKVIAIPIKPGKDPKSYRPISMMCITYKLYERLILMRIPPLSMRSWQKTKQASYMVVHVLASSLTWPRYRRRLRKKDDNRCSICISISCIRHSPTPTNDKKADGHDRWFEASSAIAASLYS